MMKWLLMLVLALLVGCSTMTGLKGVGVYVTGTQDILYCVEKWDGKQWVKVTNFIGNGTNATPEFILSTDPFCTEHYRIRPE